MEELKKTIEARGNEFIQFVLIGAFDQVDEKNYQDMKRYFSFTGEVVLVFSVTGDEVRRGDNFSYKFNCFGTYIENQVSCQLFQNSR